jgi:imidazolonepropionase-like amidohydrolase
MTRERLKSPLRTKHSGVLILPYRKEYETMATVIKRARLFDGTGSEPLDQAVVVIEGDRISAVGAESDVAVPEGEDVQAIDAGGRTVLPALMDLHVGIAGMTHDEKPYGQTARNIAASILRGVVNGRRFLDAGVTTVRVDTCGHHGIFALKEAFATGMLDGPRLIVPGRSICMTGGHAWDMGAHEADGEDEVRKAAREELKAGADWVKLMASGGAGSPTERAEDDQMTVDELRAGCEEAHKKGKYAYAHVSCAQAARNCIEAGVDSIEHGLMLEEDNIEAMVEKGLFLVPTLGVYRRLIERGEKGLVPEFMYTKALQVAERHAQSFHMALAAGVKIAAGTDSGADWYPGGDSLLFELEVMHEEGMSAKETLVSATCRAAECLRMTEDLGTLEPGKLADVLIVDGDPLADISDIRKTWMVFKEGRMVFAG